MSLHHTIGGIRNLCIVGRIFRDSFQWDPWFNINQNVYINLFTLFFGFSWGFGRLLSVFQFSLPRLNTVTLGIF